MDPRHLLASRDLENHNHDQDEEPFHFTPISTAEIIGKSKSASYDQGIVRKSKREKEAEVLKAKEKEEQQLAAKAYTDFVKAFGGDDDEEEDQSRASTQRGARGARGGGGRYAAKGKGFVRAGGGEGYNPLGHQSGPQSQSTSSSTASPSTLASASATSGLPMGPKAMMRNNYESSPSTRPPSAGTANRMMTDDQPTPGPSSSSTSTLAPPGKKRRDGDNYLEQLKREQAEREERLKQKADRMGSSVTALAARENAPVLTGSYDTGDPLTTNIHVSPLPQNVTEDSLGQFFARYGPIGSVKIMWPRIDPSTTLIGRRQLSGFVAFMRRPDAEKAAKDLDGAEWGGTIIKLSWGKPVPVPTRAQYEIEGASSRSDRERERHHRPSRRRSPSRSRSRSRSRSPKRRYRSYSPDDERVDREWPKLEDGIEERYLRTVANRILDHGSGFENALREKERNNPKFEFLRNDRLPSYHFFKMLLDRDYQPPTAPKFEDEGLAEMYSSDSDEDSENERCIKGRLGKLARKRFEALLRDLTSTREKIARGMAFALEHADAASFIVDLLIASLTIDQTPVPRKVARLHLVSDILHNSSASLPNAWVYRSIFEERLPVVFDHLGEVYKSFPGRMKAEQFRLGISSILDVWERDWILFQPRVFDDFRRRLSGLSPAQVEQEAAEEEKERHNVEEAKAEPISNSSVASSNSSAWAPVSNTTVIPSIKSTPNRPPSPIPGLGPPPSAKKPMLKFGGFKTTFMPTGLPDVPKDPQPSPTVISSSQTRTRKVEIEEEEDDVDGVEINLQAVDGRPVAAEEEDDVDGVPVPVLISGKGGVEDVDGVPIGFNDDGVDGVPVLEEDLDGQPVSIDLVEDVDGQAVDLMGDVDGEAVDMEQEDVDGVPIEEDDEDGDMFDGVALSGRR